MDDKDLYKLCFPDETRPVVAKQEPRDIFARVIKNIETMELKQYARRDLEKVYESGYVFAIGELNSDLLMVGHGGKTPLLTLLKRLQISNPRPLGIVAVIRRHSFDDARDLAGLIGRGLVIHRTKNPNWVSMENCHVQVAGMFKMIDKL
jgi:hypothetical protein